MILSTNVTVTPAAPAQRSLATTFPKTGTAGQVIVKSAGTLVKNGFEMSFFVTVCLAVAVFPQKSEAVQVRV